MRVGPLAAATQSMGVLYRQLVAQATLLAFMDVFRLMSLMALACVPLALLFRRVRARKAPSAP